MSGTVFLILIVSIGGGAAPNASPRTWHTFFVAGIGALTRFPPGISKLFSIELLGCLTSPAEERDSYEEGDCNEVDDSVGQ
jgi:hypothetical protein